MVCQTSGKDVLTKVAFGLPDPSARSASKGRATAAGWLLPGDPRVLHPQATGNQAAELQAAGPSSNQVLEFSETGGLSRSCPVHPAGLTLWASRL